MFFLLNLKRELELQPRFFGPQLKETIEQKLINEVEGSCSGEYGFIIFVTRIIDIGKGLIREGLGSATFTVNYQCVVYKPFKGEVIDAVVSSVNKMGFFAEAGPLQVFVSNHLIPEEYKFAMGGEAMYIGDDGTQIIAGCEVRLRVVGSRVDASEIFCVGTIKENYLGVIGTGMA